MPREHLAQVAGDRHLVRPEGDLAVLDPEAGGAARVVAGDVVDALAHQLDHEQAAAELAQHRVEIVAGLRCGARSASGCASRRRGRWSACRACAPNRSRGNSCRRRRRRRSAPAASRTPSSSNGALPLPRGTCGSSRMSMCSGSTRCAEAVEQERRLAVERAAARRLHVGAEQARGERRLEQHRHLAGLDLARRQARERALGGVAADRLGRGQLVGRAHRGVPGVALHVVAAPAGQRGDRRDRERVARARVAGAEAARVGGVEVRLLRRDAGAFGVGDARDRRRAPPLRSARPARSPARRRSPTGWNRSRSRSAASAASARSASSGRPAAGSSAVKRAMSWAARTVCSSAAAREVGRARVAAPLADVDRDADRLVAVALDVLGLALAHRHRQADAFGDLGDGVARAERLGRRQARRRRARGTARASRRSRKASASAPRKRWPWWKRRWRAAREGRGDAACSAERDRAEAATMITTPFPAARRRSLPPMPERPPIPTRRSATTRRRRRPRRARAAQQDAAQAGIARPAGARRGAARAARRSPRRRSASPSRCVDAIRAARAHPQPRSAAAPDAADRQAHAHGRRRAGARRRRRAPARPRPRFARAAPGRALARRADRRRRGDDALRRARIPAPTCSACARSCATRARTQPPRPSSAAAAPIASCSSSSASTSTMS